MKIVGLFKFCIVGLLLAQDAPKVDPIHYKIEFENDKVRVVRITYGPHEKSAIHTHAAGQIVCLTDGWFKVTQPDGRIAEERMKAGQTGWGGAEKHQMENLSDKPFQAILVEVKSAKSRQ